MHGEPHACGEYTLPPYYALAYIGSSPRLWGIRRQIEYPAFRRRFIPTRVGNTLPYRPCSPPRPVHPHACGEYGVLSGATMPVDGSSPRVWGIQVNEMRAREEWRFIPTRVGNTPASCPRRPASSVHPHACGEYQILRQRVDDLGGSSPRVWGILFGAVPAGAGKRFIPTRVGNTAL